MSESPLGPADAVRPLPARLAQRVVTGVTWIAIAGAVGRLFSVLSAPILTARVPPSEYGVVALVSTAVSLASTVALCGIDFSYGRFWAGGHGPKNEDVERFCWRFAMSSALLVAIGLSVCWFALLAVEVKCSPFLALLVGPGIVLSSVSSMSNIRARFRSAYPRFAAATITTSAVSTIAAIVFAEYWRPDAWAILTAVWLGMASGIAVFGLPGLDTLRSGSRVDPEQRRAIFELGLSGMTTAAMYWLISSSDRWFLGVFHDPTEIGLYAFGGTIGSLGLVFNSALTAAWFPEITQSYEQHGDSDAAEILGREWARLASSLLLVWLAVASAGGDVIHLLAHPRFHDSARYVPWVAGGVFFYGLASLANTGLWVSHDMRPSAYWWAAGALLSLMLNGVLVPWWGADGAAITGCLSYVFISCGVLWSARRSFPLRIPWGRLAGSAAVALLAALPMIHTWHSSPLWSLCLKLPIGVTVSAIVLYRSSPDWCERTLASLTRWLRPQPAE